MNLLIVGTDKSDISKHLPGKFLLIDDGALIDALTFPPHWQVTRLDLASHFFNPLKDIDYKRARDFLAVLNSVFPEGENTLTRKASNLAILRALCAKPRDLKNLIPHASDNGTLDAQQRIETLLLSPVLNKFLRQPTNFSFDGVLLARLNPAELPEFDCFVIANLLVSAYEGQVVIPDFGFYASPFHVSLIRQERLIAGVNFLDEALGLRNNLLLIERKLARKCTAEDAVVLAGYSGIPPGTNAYADFIARSIAA